MSENLDKTKEELEKARSQVNDLLRETKDKARSISKLSTLNGALQIQNKLLQDKLKYEEIISIESSKNMKQMIEL